MRCWLLLTPSYGVTFGWAPPPNRCSLPGVPVEPKLLPFPFDTDAPFEYNARRVPALEDSHAFQLHTELDVGVGINLVDPSVYDPPKMPVALHDLDREITNPALGTAVSQKRYSSA